MKRRWLLTLGAAVSLLILGFLFSSFFVAYRISWLQHRQPPAKFLWRDTGVDLLEGRAYIEFADSSPAKGAGSIPSMPSPGLQLHVEQRRTKWTDPRRFLWEFNWIEVRENSGPLHTVGAFGFMPAWPFMLPFTILPALWWRRRKREQLAAMAGLCPTCGYDLRATPDRCPECGTVTGNTNTEGTETAEITEETKEV